MIKYYVIAIKTAMDFAKYIHDVIMNEAKNKVEMGEIDDIYIAKFSLDNFNANPKEFKDDNGVTCYVEFELDDDFGTYEIAYKLRKMRWSMEEEAELRPLIYEGVSQWSAKDSKLYDDYAACYALKYSVLFDEKSVMVVYTFDEGLVRRWIDKCNQSQRIEPSNLGSFSILGLIRHCSSDYDEYDKYDYYDDCEDEDEDENDENNDDDDCNDEITLVGGFCQPEHAFWDYNC